MYKEEPMEDPYSFVDEDPSTQRGSAAMKSKENLQGMLPVAKKRGRKKKIQPDALE